MRPPIERPRAGRRGAALLLILGILGVLGWLAADIVSETLRQQAESAAFSRRERLREAAWSAAEVVVARLRETALVRGALHTVPRDGARMLAAAGYEPPRGLKVTVTVDDVSGRLGWAALREQPLRELLVSCGVPPDAAPRLADTLLDRFEPGPERRLLGMKREEYAAAGLPPPPERPPADFGELLDAPGMREFFTDEAGAPNGNFRDLCSCLCLAGDTVTPNLNTAPPALLRHLRRTGVLPDADALLAWRNGPDRLPGTPDDRYARTAADLAASGAGIPAEDGAAFTVSRLRLAVRVEFASGGAFLLSLLFDPSSTSPGFPWKLLRTEENREME